MTAYETLEASGTKFKSWQGAAKYLQRQGFSRAKATQAAKKWFNDQAAPTPTPTPEPEPEPTPEPEPPVGSLSTPPSGLRLLKEDLCTDPNALNLWRAIDAASDSRCSYHPTGGPDGGPFRRLEARDGDDNIYEYGERCEIGKESVTDTFMAYMEGQRKVTDFWMRLGPTLNVGTTTWQVVMQMKSAAVSGSPILAMEARKNWWQISSLGTSGLGDPPPWTHPARNNVWTFFRWDVTYSADSSKGRVQITVFETGNSPVVGRLLTMKTLKPEQGSRLSVGPYHNPDLPGGYVNVADVRVYG